VEEDFADVMQFPDDVQGVFVTISGDEAEARSNRVRLSRCASALKQELEPSR
jgi:hypothetical protein